MIRLFSCYSCVEGHEEKKNSKAREGEHNLARYSRYSAGTKLYSELDSDVEGGKESKTNNDFCKILLFSSK